MKENRLLDALGEIDDKIIREAESASYKDFKRTKRPSYIRNYRTILLKLVPACLVLLVIAVGILSSAIRKYGVTGSFGPSGPKLSKGCSNGCNDSENYMAFHGAALPLIVTGDESVEVSRDIGFDFTADTKEGKVKINDWYRIENNENQDITLQLIYPYLVNLNWADGCYNWATVGLPEVSYNGNGISDYNVTSNAANHDNKNTTNQDIADHDIIISGSSIPDKSDKETLGQATYSWKDEANVIDADSELYSTEFISERLQMLNQKISVYTIDCAKSVASYDKDDTVAMTFTDADKADFLLYNMKGFDMTYDAAKETKTTYLFNANDDKTHQIVFIGGDEPQCEANLYTDGSCTVKDDSDEVKVTARVMTVAEYIEEAAKSYLDERKINEADDSVSIADTLVKSQMQACFYDHYERDESGDELKWGYVIPQYQECDINQRMIYLVRTITISSQSQCEIMYSYIQNPNYDYNGTKWKGCNGYGLVTDLSNAITCTSQKASVQLPKKWKIVEQNFGFDIEKQVKEVELDSKIRYYYMLIRRPK